ncbi:MAG: FeoB-associated Cys-rich membrane protein [Faecousia sp.]
MGWADIAVLALVAVWLAATILWLLHRKKTGKSGCSGCCADCSGCSKSRKE